MSAHIVDTTEGYFRAFDAAQRHGEVPDAVRPAGDGEKANEVATAFRGVPQAELVRAAAGRLHKMQEILEPIGPDDWTGLMVTHAYMGPVPAFFYAAGQLMDYGVHSWDIRAGQRRGARAVRGRRRPARAVHVRDLAGHRAHGRGHRPFTIGIRVSGRNAGDYQVSVSSDGPAYEQGDIESLPASSSSMRAAWCCAPSAGQLRHGARRHGPGERYLNSFFRI